LRGNAEPFARTREEAVDELEELLLMVESRKRCEHEDSVCS
jgi:hypothetical protein